MSRDEVVAKAAEAMRGKGLIRLLDETRINLVSALYDAGLLATPEMSRVIEAAKRLRGLFGDRALTSEYRELVAALEAYAASVRKPERYVRDEATPGCCCIKDTTTGKWMKAEEIIAKLNAEDRP